VLRLFFFSLGGLALGWCLDRLAWPSGVRPGRPARAGTAMAALGAAGLGTASAAFRPLGEAALLGSFLGVVGAMAVVDSAVRIIPNRLVYPAAGAFLVAIAAASVFGARLHVVGGVAGMAAYGGALLVIAGVAPTSMGMGDAKAAALIGLVLGSVRLEAVWVAALAGAIAGGVGAAGALLILRSGRDTTIPYGPFLAVGAAVAALAIPRMG
jgi:leader peptidase (prepilin peptidase) / N-methyltransferase